MSGSIRVIPVVEIRPGPPSVSGHQMPPTVHMEQLRLHVETPATLAARMAADAAEQAGVATEDALRTLREAATRAFEVCGAVPAHVMGVGVHARLSRLAAHIHLELRQIRELP